MSNNNSKKDCIIKIRDSMAYLKNIKAKEYIYTFNAEEAKKYTKSEAEKIIRKDEFEIVNYNEELYKSKERKYKLYSKLISNEDYNIKKDDLIYFIEEYEFAPDGSGKFTSYISLKEEYPNSKLIDEIVRIGQIIKHKNNVIWHEALKELAKDKEFNDGIYNKVVLTEKDEKQYKESKTFLEIMKKKFPYDYDVEKQYEMLDTAFREKYISKEIYKEYLELYHDEELEEYEEEQLT